MRLLHDDEPRKTSSQVTCNCDLYTFMCTTSLFEVVVETMAWTLVHSGIVLKTTSSKVSMVPRKLIIRTGRRVTRNFFFVTENMTALSGIEYPHTVGCLVSKWTKFRVYFFRFKLFVFQSSFGYFETFEHLFYDRNSWRIRFREAIARIYRFGVTDHISKQKPDCIRELHSYGAGAGSPLTPITVFQVYFSKAGPVFPFNGTSTDFHFIRPVD